MVEPVDPKMATPWQIGESPVRLEDERFVRGQGEYLDDRRYPGSVRAVFVRSDHAHARIEGIDVAAARELPGVLAVLTGNDVTGDGLAGVAPIATYNPHDNRPFQLDDHPLLAVGKVRYVGQPVAMVIAESLAEAQDGAEAVRIDYAPLAPVVSLSAADAPEAPQLSESIPRNTSLEFELGPASDCEAAFAAAAHVVSLSNVNHRVVINSMEPRGAVASFDAGTSGYQLDISSQNVHTIRDFVAKSLRVEPAMVRLSAFDVGGGFGNRNFVYPEYALLAWASRRVGRTVKWISTRSEVFCADHQARDFEATARLALDATGRFLALSIDSRANLGAYPVGSTCGVQTGQYTTAPGALYDIPLVHLRIKALLTNTTPIGVTRGPGFAEAVHLMERLVDKAALECGFDRFELRRLNLVPPAAMPWTNSVGTTIDSGDFPACLEAALDRADEAGFPARRAAAAERGEWLGLGLACHVKATGGLPQENVALEFKADRVMLSTGTMAIGQGHETSFRQILGSLLGIGPGAIEYRAGDSSFITMGGGHGSSRATYMAGTAMARAADLVVTKAKTWLADHLGAGAPDIEFADGHFRVGHTNQSMGVLEVAAMAAAAGRPLDTYYHFERDAMTFPSGCHVAEVCVDPETGRVRLLRYTAVDDYGVEVNPMLVLGQMSGAIAQGVGQALLEGAVNDAESGQLLTGSFMDYALPRADDLPAFSLHTRGQPCTTNPLGVKGCGEAGAIAGFPAIANAISHACHDQPFVDLAGPASPGTLWQYLRGG